MRDKNTQREEIIMQTVTFMVFLLHKIIISNAFSLFAFLVSGNRRLQTLGSLRIEYFLKRFKYGQ